MSENAIENPAKFKTSPNYLHVVMKWARANLFSSPLNTVLTVLFAWLIWKTIPASIDWAVVRSVTGFKTATDCRAPEAGACWSFVYEKWRFILFGVYPFEQQWRPAIVVVLIISLLVASCVKARWGRSLTVLWLLGILLGSLLMWGRVFGMSFVEATQWGGLPLTLIIAIVGMIAGFPLAVALALGRRSNLPAI